jgi:hypothetical protein
MKKNKKAQKNMLLVLVSTTSLLLLLTLVSFFIPKKGIEKIQLSLDTKELIKDITKKRSENPEIVAQPDEVILSAVQNTDCNIDLTTNYKEVVLETEIDFVTDGECLFTNVGSISDSGKFFAYKDVSGGVDSMFVLYILDYDKTMTLGVLGTSYIMDWIFLEDDKLAVIHGYLDNFDQQSLVLYDTPMISMNFNKNVRYNSDHFVPDNISYLSTIRLPNTGETHWNIDVEGEYIQTFGETGVLLSQHKPFNILWNSSSYNISPKVASELALLRFTRDNLNLDTRKPLAGLVFEDCTDNAWKVNIISKVGGTSSTLETYLVNAKTGEITSGF